MLEQRQEERVWRSSFKKNFPEHKLRRMTTLQLATNVRTIYLALVGFSKLNKDNVAEVERNED